MTSRNKSQLAAGFIVLAAFGAALWLFFQPHAKETAQPAAIPEKSPVAVAPSGQAPAASVAASDLNAPPQTAVPPSVSNPIAAPAVTVATDHPSPAPQPAAATPPYPATPAATAAQPQPAEVRSTRAMYMAHAPLRTPEVANPDSETNRRILQTMVDKALSRQETAR